MVRLLLFYLIVTVLAWLGIQPKQTEHEKEAERTASYLRSSGVQISAADAAGLTPLTIGAGNRLALVGSDTYRKHYFCDWILGFVNVAGSTVKIKVGETVIGDAGHRTKIASLLGRSPLLYGETIQESLLYRTNNVRKQELYEMIERFYGPSLRARTSPQNPLLDVNGKPIPTQILTAREHIEIAQINLILQKTPLMILDLSSELMNEALNQGFRPSRELIQSGKTIIVILPPQKDLVWAEEILGTKMTSSLEFN